MPRSGATSSTCRWTRSPPSRTTTRLSPRITEDIRRFAAAHGMQTVEAIEEGMREKAEEFREKGGELYVEAGD